MENFQINNILWCVNSPKKQTQPKRRIRDTYQIPQTETARRKWNIQAW